MFDNTIILQILTSMCRTESVEQLLSRKHLNLEILIRMGFPIKHSASIYLASYPKLSFRYFQLVIYGLLGEQ